MTPDDKTTTRRDNRAERARRSSREKAMARAQAAAASKASGRPTAERPPRPVRDVSDAASRPDAAAAVTASKTKARADLKLPPFPAPVKERPEGMQAEEDRRKRLLARRDDERADILAEADEDEQERLKAKWAREDSLEYQSDPDDLEVEVYPIQEPWSYVQIIFNRTTNELTYHAIEPMLSQEERLLLGFIEETIVDVLDVSPADMDREDLHDYLVDRFESVIKEYSIVLGDEDTEPEESKERLLYYVLRDFLGEGPLEILMGDPMIEDISCDGPHEALFIYHRRHESMQTTIQFRDHDHLDGFIIRLAQRSGKHVSIAEPVLDATMPDGSRLQATYGKEVSTFGSTFTIRKFRDTPFSPIDLVRFGTMDAKVLSYLWLVIQHRSSGLFAGGTASGKTTALNAVSLFIPPQMKVVSIEDTREIQVAQKNWIAGITRGGFGPRDAHGRQAGEIDMFALLKNALRQRPEYIIVGEVRGAEAYNLFQAMATGHSAYGTLHADSVDAAIHRLESDPINIPRPLLEALDIICVQILTRVGDMRVRRTKTVTEMVGLDPNTKEILTNEVFRWDPAHDEFEYTGTSYNMQRIALETGRTEDQVEQDWADREKVIRYLIRHKMHHYRDVHEVINAYYKHPEQTMRIVEEDEPWP